MINQVKQRQVGQNALFVVENPPHPTDMSPVLHVRILCDHYRSLSGLSMTHALFWQW